MPNKLGGVIALVISVRVLFFMPFMYQSKFKGITWYYRTKVRFWCFVRTCLILTEIGAGPVEEPYIYYGRVFSAGYFLYFIRFRLRPRDYDKYFCMYFSKN